MARKRPCSLCRRWFVPQHRAGVRQRVCSAESCQAERHRRACERWHEQHPEYDREHRLRDRVRRDSGPGEPLARDPLTEVAWEAARDAVGLEVAVIVEETAKVLVGWARDAVHAQSMEITRRLAKVMHAPARDAMGTGSGPRSLGAMQVELNELELRYAGLRVRDAARAARMRASLAADGQQSAVTVISAAADAAHRFVLIDGYLRVSALRYESCAWT